MRIVVAFNTLSVILAYMTSNIINSCHVHRGLMVIRKQISNTLYVLHYLHMPIKLQITLEWRVSFVVWFWIDASLTLQTVYGSTHLITTTIFAINAQSKAIPKFLSIALDSIFCLAHNQRCTANFGQHKYECMLCVFIISLMSMFIWTIFLFASTKIVWNIYQKS